MNESTTISSETNRNQHKNSQNKLSHELSKSMKKRANIKSNFVALFRFNSSAMQNRSLTKDIWHTEVFKLLLHISIDWFCCTTKKPLVMRSLISFSSSSSFHLSIRQVLFFLSFLFFSRIDFTLELISDQKFRTER